MMSTEAATAERGDCEKRCCGRVARQLTRECAGLYDQAHQSADYGMRTGGRAVISEQLQRSIIRDAKTRSRDSAVTYQVGHQCSNGNVANCVTGQPDLNKNSVSGEGTNY